MGAFNIYGKIADLVCIFKNNHEDLLSQNFYIKFKEEFHNNLVSLIIHCDDENRAVK
jgi:hypothetical protein